MNEAAAKIREECFRLLASREHSRAELLQKLTARGFNKDVALTVIEELVEQGWQSDLRYAESYARSRILKGYGAVHITCELRRNGVKIESIPEFNLDNLAESSAGGWMALLERIYLKKYGPMPVSDYKEWSKRCRFLTQRGFTNAMIADLAGLLKNHIE